MITSNTKQRQGSICQINYDAALRRLRITFNSGEQVDYYSVSPAVYAEMAHAESVTDYFNRAVKGFYRSNIVPGRERANQTNPMGAIVRSSLAS